MQVSRSDTRPSEAAVPCLQRLARDREQAAAQLEAAIADLGAAYREYEWLTLALGDRLHADLTRRLETPIVLHLAGAGLSAFLERKLTGRPGSLRTLVAEQHDRAGLESGRASELSDS